MVLSLIHILPEKGIRYLVEAFKNVKTDKKLVIAGGSSDTDSFMEELKELALSLIHILCGAHSLAEITPDMVRV